MSDNAVHAETRESTVSRRCPRCRVQVMRPTIHIVWYRDGNIAQWWKCGCGAHIETHTDIEPIIL